MDQKTTEGLPSTHDDDVPEVNINNPDELRALHRMLYARKFDGPEDEFFASPFVAAVQRRLAAALRDIDGPKWDVWADARNHPREVDKVRSYLNAAGTWWSSATEELRRSHVIDLLSPLIVPDDLLAELLNQ
jgi:hypothetical protein